MHKKILIPLLIPALVILLGSCGWQVPTSARVITNPTVQAGFGTKTFALSEYLGIDNISELFGESEDMRVYDYQDGGTTQKYLIHMPIVTVQVDVGDYLDQTFSQDIEPISISIPAVDFSSSFNTTVDIGSIAAGTITQPAPVSLPVAETGTSMTEELPATTLEMAGFDTVTLESGSLDLVLSLDGASAGFSVDIVSIELRNPDTNALISNATPNVAVPLDPGTTTVSLPLALRTIPNRLSLVVEVSISGGTFGTTRNINVASSLNNVVLSGATGIDFAGTNFPISTSIPVSAGSGFHSATIGAGAIDMTLAALPTGWTGFTRNTELSITQTGGLSLTQNPTTDTAINLPLTGETLNTESISVSGNFAISASDASFSGLSGGILTLGSSVATSITNFATLVIDAPSGITDPISYTEPTSPELLDWVQSVTFDRVGMALTLTNTLPAGNDLDITVNSAAFDLVNVENTFTAGATDETLDFVRTNLTYTPGPTMDFTITLEPVGLDDPSAGLLTLSNITPGGDPITISGRVDIIAEWSSASIDANSLAPIVGTFPEGDVIDLSEISSFLGDLEFDEIPVYLYLSGIDAGLQLDGYLEETHGDIPSGLIGSSSSPQTISLVPKGPVFPATGNVFSGTLPEPSITAGVGLEYSFNLAEVLNATPADLVLTYNFQPSGSVIISQTNLTARELTAELVIVLPLALNKADPLAPAEIVIDDLSEEGLDLFDREAGQTDEDMDRVFNSLKEMYLNLAYANSTGITGTVSLRQGAWESEPFTLASGTGDATFRMTEDDFQFIRDTIPFAPDIVISTNDDDLMILRNAEFTMTLTSSISTEVDETFEF